MGGVVTGYINLLILLIPTPLVLALINPRRACAARVTVVVLSVCLSVCMYVCPNTLFWQYVQLEV